MGLLFHSSLSCVLHSKRCNYTVKHNYRVREKCEETDDLKLDKYIKIKQKEQREKYLGTNEQKKKPYKDAFRKASCDLLNMINFLSLKHILFLYE